MAYNLDKKVVFVPVDKFNIIENMNITPKKFKKIFQPLEQEDIVMEHTEDSVAFTEFGLRYYSNIVIGK